MEFTGGAEHIVYREYKRRWVIFFWALVMSILFFHHWTTYSAITVEDLQLYGWGITTITLLTLWLPILYLPLSFVIPPLLDKIGLRMSITLTALLIAVASCIRVISTRSPTAELLAHLSQIINAFGGSLLITSVPLLAAEWFAAEKRLLITSLLVSGSCGGIALSYSTALFIHSASHFRKHMGGMAIVSVLLLICIVFDQMFFNSIPPLPPSFANEFGTQKRLVEINWKREYRTILKEKKWLHIFSFFVGLYLGVLLAWSTLFNILFHNQNTGYSNCKIAWVGIIYQLSIMFGGAFFGALCNKASIRKRLKMWITTLVTLTGICYLLFTAIVNDLSIANMHFRQWHIGSIDSNSLNTAIFFVALGSFFNAGTYGFAYEMAVEMTFPCRETTAAAVLSFYICLFCAVFIILTLVISSAALNWVAAAVQFISAFGLLYYRRRFEMIRAEYDNEERERKWTGFDSVASTETNRLSSCLTSEMDPNAEGPLLLTYQPPNSRNMSINP